MHGDAPDQSGASGRGYCIERLGRAHLAGPARSAMRACFAMVLVIVSLPVPGRGQPEGDTSRVIPVHPRVTTILQLPDDVERARFTGASSGMMRATTLREFLYIQPRADLQAGTEVVLHVKTATLRRRFRLRVVDHARDAWENVVVLEPEAEPAPAASAPTGAPAPAASATTDAPAPAAPETQDDSGPTGQRDEAPAVLHPGRTELSWHFIGSLGFTGLDVAGQQPSIARQPHAGLGARLAVTRPNARWALEANLAIDWPGGPISSFSQDGNARAQIDMEGPWLRVESGARVQLGGTKWNPSLYVGGGVQAHLRRTDPKNALLETHETMPHGAVLVLGMGLQRRARKLLLGVDVQFRKGWPDGYHSISALWTVGSFLDADQENER